LWRELIALRGETGDDDPVFRSTKGGTLDASRAHPIADSDEAGCRGPCCWPGGVREG